MASKYSFSGHETFPLRLNWLKKGVNAVNDSEAIFHSDDAIVEFGVGKNMVRSIRHWGLATEVLQPHPDSGKTNALRVSDLGAYLLGEKGVDPYCEDEATLWLLHWLLCRSPKRSTLWHFIFGYWRKGALELQSLQPTLKRWLDERDVRMPSTATLSRDFQCFLNTYTAPYLDDSHLETIVNFPLTSLGLLYKNGGVVYLREGQQRNLPPEIFAYAVLDYWDRNFGGKETLSSYDILTNRASPGQIFLLDEEQAYELVDRIETFDVVPFRFDSTAGIHQFYRTSNATPKTNLFGFFPPPPPPPHTVSDLN